MGVLRRDIDIKLISMVVLVVVAIVGITLFYNYSASDIVDKYDDLSVELEMTENNLSKTRTKLDKCMSESNYVTQQLNETIVFHEESQEEFNVLYEETSDQLETTSASLEGALEELDTAKSDLADAESMVVFLEDELATAEDRVDTFESNCVNSGDADSCIANVANEFDTLYDDIKEFDDI